jgi:hypothetical protein
MASYFDYSINKRVFIDEVIINFPADNTSYFALLPILLGSESYLLLGITGMQSAGVSLVAKNIRYDGIFESGSTINSSNSNVTINMLCKGLEVKNSTPTANQWRFTVRYYYIE